MFQDGKFNWKKEDPDRVIDNSEQGNDNYCVNLTRVTFSRALTSTTVLVSSAMRLSLMDLTTSCGVLGLETLKNENDMMVYDDDRLLNGCSWFDFNYSVIVIMI